MSLNVETEPARAPAQNWQELLWLIFIMSSSLLQLVQASCLLPVCLPICLQSTSDFSNSHYPFLSIPVDACTPFFSMSFSIISVATINLFFLQMENLRKKSIDSESLRKLELMRPMS